MKKFVSVIFCALLSLFVLVGCGNTPKAAVKDYLNTLRKEGAKYNDSITNKLNKEFSSVFKEMNYKILDVDVDGNYATVEVEIESKNISVALTDSMLTGYMYAYAGVYDYELDTAMEVVMAENLKNQTIEKSQHPVFLTNQLNCSYKSCFSLRSKIYICRSAHFKIAERSQGHIFSQH